MHLVKLGQLDPFAWVASPAVASASTSGGDSFGATFEQHLDQSGAPTLQNAAKGAPAAPNTGNTLPGTIANPSSQSAKPAPQAQASPGTEVATEDRGNLARPGQDKALASAPNATGEPEVPSEAPWPAALPQVPVASVPHPAAILLAAAPVAPPVAAQTVHAHTVASGDHGKAPAGKAAAAAARAAGPTASNGTPDSTTPDSTTPDSATPGSVADVAAQPAAFPAGVVAPSLQAPPATSSLALAGAGADRAKPLTKTVSSTAGKPAAQASAVSAASTQASAVQDSQPNASQLNASQPNASQPNASATGTHAIDAAAASPDAPLGAVQDPLTSAGAAVPAHAFATQGASPHPAAASGTASSPDSAGLLSNALPHTPDNAYGAQPVTAAALVVTPTVLEVGIAGGSHGWLKVRAELADTGGVQAQLTASSPDAATALHRDLPALTAYLQSEQVGVSSLTVHTASQSASAQPVDTAFTGSSSFASTTDAGTGSQAGEPSGGSTGSQPQDAPGERFPGSESQPRNGVPGSAALSDPAGLHTGLNLAPLLSADAGGGGWLSVRV